ncbi:right-handed parallel beta-helix repeat-containing protein [Winogradskyella wichelsiae]|uniref:right-handed parallel beta-helix repeat-containing protein n=1 Tax=Winogradskyella wichelsiae TaxID=2697007 RepID=UPI003EF86EE4
MRKSIGFILIILNCFQVFSSEIKTIKKVNNVKEFFAALGHNTEVVITCETLDFTLENLEKELNIEETSEFWASRVDPIKRVPQSYYLDYGIVLYGFNNLTIRGEKNTNIISNDDYRVVLNFKKCNNIVLENLNIYHTPSDSKGGELFVSLSNDIIVNNCAFSGNTVYGVKLIGVNNATFNNCVISNKDFSAISVFNSFGVTFFNCEIYNIGDYGSGLIYADLSSMVFKSCFITSNTSNKFVYGSYKKLYQHPTRFINCNISNNSFNSQNYIDGFTKPVKEKSRDEKRYILFTTFKEVLEESLNSDHDNYNEYLRSFFDENCKITYTESSKVVSNFITYYYHLKGNNAINTYKLENLKTKYVITIETDDNSLIKLNITFNENNKIVKLNEQLNTKTNKG